ncbi:MAG: SCO family protein [Myxococcales bacterium]|nr:SCO family protein [Myxococcales bacterium]
MTTKALMLGLCLWATASLAEVEPKNVLALPTAWKDEAGAPVTLERFKGRWYALTFIYTSCAGSCPLTTKKLKRLDAALEQAGKRLDLVVVSLDPSHDTPPMLKQYRERYGIEGAKRWRILVGDDAQVRTLTMLLEFKYTKNPESGVIMHDNTVYLVDPEGSVHTSMSSLDQPMEAFLAAVRTRGSAPVRQKR